MFTQHILRVARYHNKFYNFRTIARIEFKISQRHLQNPMHTNARAVRVCTLCTPYRDIQFLENILVEGGNFCYSFAMISKFRDMIASQIFLAKLFSLR